LVVQDDIGLRRFFNYDGLNGFYDGLDGFYDWLDELDGLDLDELDGLDELFYCFYRMDRNL
jgi:hypothetical protein